LKSQHKADASVSLVSGSTTSELIARSNLDALRLAAGWESASGWLLFDHI
jgi:hypothetical protein